jgi:hypothetical protein
MGSPYNQPFNNDQTTPFSQQSPPPPPYIQPGQYLPQQPVRQKKNAWRWYKRQRKPAKWGIGCGVLLLVFSCIVCSSVFASGFHDVGSATTATATVAPTHAVRTGSTAVASKPTATPKPTVAPTAPPVVVVTTQPPAPTQAPAPTAPPAATCSGVVDGGTCYSTDSAGGTIASTVPGDFCSLVSCVSDFATKQNGYVVLCGNGVYSHSGGVKGVCSRDGGVASTLYQH